MGKSTIKNKKLLYLHKYGRKAASFRYRYELFVDKLQSEGLEVSCQSLLSDAYLEGLFSSGRRPWIHVIWGYLKRFCFLTFAPRHDLKVIYLELFPELPYFFERLFLKPNSYIIEMDDAYFLKYDHSSLKNKIPRLLKNAKAVIVGSHYLKEYSEQWNENVALLPTVVDLKKYPTPKEHREGPTSIGWLGSPSTSVELDSLSGVLQKLEAEHDVKFIFVGAPQKNLGLQSSEFRIWKEARQIQDIYEMDIGIMPLEDTEWNKGKCGFKLIQYMAAGIPVVASPVGENLHIVKHGESGFCPESKEEWLADLGRLVESAELRQTMGRNALAQIQQNYSFEAVWESYLALLSGSL